MNPLIAKTLEVARAELGVREVGLSNTGVMVDRFLASVGLEPGEPWCMAFVYWSAEQAAKAMGLPNPLLRTGACEATREFARARGILYSEPQPGDEFLKLSFNGKTPHAHHTGWVTAVSGAVFHTIEGNTNTDGSRDGYEVAELSRTVSDIYAFVRWSSRCEMAPEEYHLLATGGGHVCDVRVAGGHGLAPVRTWANYLGFEVAWSKGHPQFDGQDAPGEITVLNGTAYAPLRDLADAAGLTISVNDATKTIQLSNDTQKTPA